MASTETATVTRTASATVSTSTVAGATPAQPAADGSSSGSTRTCYPSAHIPAAHIPAAHIPASTIPASTIPGTTINGVKMAPVHLPATHLPAVNLPAVNLPAVNLPGGCFEVPRPFALADTTVRVSDYGGIDPKFSSKLSDSYWSTAGTAVSVPDPTAPGFGEMNAAGFPRNQYVRPYFRSDGTMVSGYWRNDPTDGLPTCHVISC